MTFFRLPRIGRMIVPASLTRIGKTLRRTAVQAIPTIFGIVILNFFLFKLAPGDAADVMAGESGSATVETMAALRHRFGLDNSTLVQLLDYLNNLAHFSLGFSPRYNMPVAALIGQRLPGTLVLMGVALGIAILLGVVLGSIMSAYAGKLPDRLISILSLIFYSTPGFWVGLMLIVLFSVKLRWLPSSGMETLFSGYTGIARLGDLAAHLVMPALTLALFQLALYTRMLRASLLDILRQDFIRTARAKGLTERRVMFRHALRNALLPLVTMIGMHFAATLGGSVVVESVFAWPGLGRLAFDAVEQRDVNLLAGIVLFSSMIVIVVNLAVDLIQGWLDPRIEAA